MLAGGQRAKTHKSFSTKYIQWYKGERPVLFAQMQYSHANIPTVTGAIPKLGGAVAGAVVSKVAAVRGGVIAEGLSSGGRVKLYFHRTPGYWIRIMDFEPHFRSPTATRSVHHIRELSVRDPSAAKLFGAVISSSLYFLWFFAEGNCRNLTLDDVKQFPVGRPSTETLRKVAVLFDELMQDFQRNSFVNTRGDTEFQEFDWGKSKPIIDRIDIILAKHYGLTEDELDFVVNYDVKIRMGHEAEGEEE